MYALRYIAGLPYYLVPLKGFFIHHNGKCCPLHEVTCASRPCSQCSALFWVLPLFYQQVARLVITVCDHSRPISLLVATCLGVYPHPGCLTCQSLVRRIFRRYRLTQTPRLAFQLRVRISLIVLATSLFLRYYSGRRFLFCPYSFNRRLRRGISPLYEPPRPGMMRLI